LNPEVLFRVDGSPAIGLGHLVRCIALAKMLNDDFEITFSCKEISEAMASELFASNFRYNIIENELEFIAQLHDKLIVVLDGYHFSADYQKQIKSCNTKLVCIDDLHEKEFVADLIINHTPSIDPQDYKASPCTQFALGLDYALLRPTFLEQAKKQRTIKKIETVMICFGGSDYLNLTQTLLSIALEFPQFKKIIVVTGSAYQTTKCLIELVSSDSRIEYRHALNEHQMLDVMQEADLAIVPASGILFEVLASGCIAISGSFIENQELVYNNFKNARCIIDAGNFSYQKSYEAIVEALGGDINQSILIDGQTAIRFSKLFNQLYKEFSINLRKVTANDLDITYGWATNSGIRRFSFQQHLIKKPEHTNWFLKKLIDINCFYSIVEYDSIPIGSIRFDISEGEAMISYLLDPMYHGQGLGQLILKKGIEWLLIVNISGLIPINVISGVVMKTNLPSIKAFERLGFVKIEQMENYKFEKWIY